MQKRMWVQGVVMGLVCVLAVTGCSRKGKKGLGAGGDDLLNPLGTGGEFGPGGLSGRPAGEMIPIAGEFTPVYFDYDSSQIKDSERPAIEIISQRLGSGGTTSVIIEGNTDERGSAEYNLALGERRALAVRAYLINLGVDGSRIQTKSLGKESPACYEHDENCWSHNRRGDFKLFE